MKDYIETCLFESHMYRLFEYHYIRGASLSLFVLALVSDDDSDILVWLIGIKRKV